jgi:hypothetical protein
VYYAYSGPKHQNYIDTDIIFISGDVRRENVPGGDVLLHAEFTYYYYPGDIKFPCKYIALNQTSSSVNCRPHSNSFA